MKWRRHRVRWHAGDTMSGPAGYATEVIVTKHRNVDQSATVAAWFLRCPGQSPAWDAYAISVIHLRPIDGQSRPPVVNWPGATHEVFVYALDPTRNPDPNPDTWSMLRPVNVVEQVQLPSDDAARELARLAARAVVDGVLPAEPALAGQVEPWRTTLIRTAAHLRGEEHAP